MLRPEDTEMKFIRIVRSAHLNAYGTLYGGWMMRWIIDAASSIAMNLAKGPVVVGYVDDLHFLSPIYLGELVIYKARAEYTSKKVAVVSVKVWGENPETGKRKPSTFAMLAYVSIDREGKPRDLPVRIDGSELGRKFYEAVKERVTDRHEKVKDISTDGYEPISSIIVREEQLINSDLMYAGYLLYLLDEVGSIRALRYSRGPAVTACLDRLAFYAPMYKGDLVSFYSKVTRVWNTSMEISIKTLVENPSGVRHTTTSYMVFVGMGDKGPRNLPPMEDGDPLADRRRKERMRILRRIKERMLHE